MGKSEPGSQPTVESLLNAIEQLPSEDKDRLLKQLLTQTPAPASTQKSMTRPAQTDAAHPAFGLWANRADVQDTATFIQQLRQRIETRRDGTTDTHPPH